MKELTHYLKQATRGLPRAQKQDLWNELEADILERVSHLRSFGLNEQEALQKTLAQFGAPQSIQKGMHQVYILPRMTRWLAGMLAAGSLIAISSAAASTPIATQSSGLTYLRASLHDLETQLREQNVIVKRSNTALDLVFPSGQKLSLPLTKFNLQDNRLMLNNLLDAALRANLKVTVGGWDTLKVQIEQVELTLEPSTRATQTDPLGTEKNLNNFKSWYEEAALGWLHPELHQKAAALTQITPEVSSTLKGQSPDLANQIVAAAIYSKGQLVYVQATQVDPQGGYTLKVPAGTYRLRPGQNHAQNPELQDSFLRLMVYSGVYTSGARKPFKILPTQMKQLKVQAQQTLQLK